MVKHTLYYFFEAFKTVSEHFNRFSKQNKKLQLKKAGVFNAITDLLTKQCVIFTN